MSADERPATRAFKDRWNNLLAFWKERRRGPYDRDFTEWRIEMGLTPRTAKESHWDAGETLGKIRIVFEKKEKFWEYCGSPAHEKDTTTGQIQEKSIGKRPKLSKEAKDFFERMEIREKMEAGPCRHCCEMDSDTDCRTCIKLRSLKDKGFLENQEEE